MSTIAIVILVVCVAVWFAFGVGCYLLKRQQFRKRLGQWTVHDRANGLLLAIVGGPVGLFAVWITFCVDGSKDADW